MAPHLSPADDKVKSGPDYRAAAQQAALSALEDGALLRVRVTSNSMSPWMRRGEEVRVQPCAPQEISPGDVLVIHQDGVWITHRLIRATQQGLTLKGDASPRRDPPRPARSLVGRVTGLWQEETFQDWTRPPWREIQRRAARWSLLHARLSAPLENGPLPRVLSVILLRLLGGFFRLGHTLLYRLSAAQTRPGD